MQTAETPLEMRLWSVAEYHRMAEVGILEPDEPVELIAGQIIKKMSPQGTPHATSITLTRLLLENLLGKRVLVRTQLPITLNNFSEPEPDVAVVLPDVMRYIDHHPTPPEVYLLIEVADTTLKKDCGIKAQDYAVSGIQDYWVLDIINRQLHLFREPTAQGYQTQVILSAEAQVSPLSFADITITIGEILPPVMYSQVLSPES